MKRSFLVKRCLSIVVAFISLTFSCDDDRDELSSDEPTASAVIDGSVFEATETKATNVGQSLEIRLKDSDQEITLFLDDVIAGSYTVKNSLTGGRAASSSDVFVQVVGQDGVVFYGLNGDVTVTLDAAQRASGTFRFEAKSIEGSTLSVINGQFSGILVGDLSSLGCLLASLGEGGYVTVFHYDSDGNIVRMFQSGDYPRTTIFSYSNGKLVRMFGETPYYTEEATFAYNTAGLISRKTTGSSDSPDIYIKDYVYNSTGQLTTVRESEKATGEQGSVTISYSGANVTRYETETEVITFSDFDNQLSHGKLLLKAFKDQPALVEYALWAPALSEHNPGKESPSYLGAPEDPITISYEYNDAGYPTKVAYNSGDDESVVIATFIGCD